MPSTLPSLVLANRIIIGAFAARASVFSALDPTALKPLGLPKHVRYQATLLPVVSRSGLSRCTEEPPGRWMGHNGRHCSIRVGASVAHPSHGGTPARRKPITAALTQPLPTTHLRSLWSSFLVPVADRPGVDKAAMTS